MDGLWVWTIGLGGRMRVRKDKRLQRRRRGHEGGKDERDTPFLTSVLLLAHKGRAEMLEAWKGQWSSEGFPSSPVMQSFVPQLKRRNLKMLSP